MNAEHYPNVDGALEVRAARAGSPGRCRRRDHSGWACGRDRRTRDRPKVFVAGVY